MVENCPKSKLPKRILESKKLKKLKKIWSVSFIFIKKKFTQIFKKSKILNGFVKLLSKIMCEEEVWI
jgi:hypothetical protein